jgi:hypothetical protein
MPNAELTPVATITGFADKAGTRVLAEASIVRGAA